MSIKIIVRNWINSNSTTRKWFVAFCARFTIRLYALQKYLSLEDLKKKRRVSSWQRILSSVENMPVERIVVVAGKATFVYKDGSAFEVANSGTSMANALFVDAAYEKHETSLLPKIVKPGWTVIDAGANFGWYAVHLSRLVGQMGKVFAFEPVPDSFRELNANAALNSCQNLETLGMALGNGTDPITFFVPQIEMGAGAASQFLDVGKKIQVPMTRLDDFVKSEGLPKVDFIKADIEGGELGLLRGGDELLKTSRPSILIEIVDVHCRRFGHAPEDVYQFLADRGYTGRYIDDHGELIDLDPKRLPNGNYYFEHKSTEQ